MTPSAISSASDPRRGSSPFVERWRARHDLSAPALFGAALSASIGCRPQYAIALVPMLLAGCIAMRRWRARGAALAAFTVTSLAWFVPLVVACAGWDRFVQYQRTQIATVASADAFASRMNCANRVPNSASSAPSEPATSR